MATPQSMNTEQTDIYASAARLVWVLNRDRIHSYKGNFRGNKVEIPPNEEKIPKLAQHGGNLMPYLEARRFITDLKDPQGFLEDDNGGRQPIFRSKELYDMELTQEEFDMIVKKTPAQVKKEVMNEERAAKRKINDALDKKTNKRAIEDEE